MNAKAGTIAVVATILLVTAYYGYTVGLDISRDERSSPTKLLSGDKRLFIPTPVYDEKDRETHKWERKPRKVFVDLGAGCGDSYYRHRKEHEEDADEWEAYLWEPSPQMHEFYLDEFQKEYPHVHIMPFAAGVHDGSLKLFLHKGQEHVTDKSEFKNQGKCSADVFTSPAAGSTMFKEAGDAGEPVNVKVRNFPEWLKEQELSSQDTFILKIDIEGGEFDILDRMLNDPNDNDLCYTDELKVGFHPKLITRHHAKKLDEKFATFHEDFPLLFKKKCGFEVNMKVLH